LVKEKASRSISQEPAAMRLAKFLTATDPTPAVGLVQEGDRLLTLARGHSALSELLHGGGVEARVRRLAESAAAAGEAPRPLAAVRLLAPIDRHEVWGAGVTYERSKIAREEESAQGGSFYDLVYRAPRPELFFKATPERVVGPGAAVRVRSDTAWCVPEPEVGLVLAPDLSIVGYTAGNDVSARDIEGENPLYLPQAKVYDACCALGPYVTLAGSMPPAGSIGVHLVVTRDGATTVEGRTSVARMARTFEELVRWLGLDNTFPNGAVLLTGTGVVPPDEFSLRPGDLVRITIDGVGVLENSVVQAPPAATARPA